MFSRPTSARLRPFSAKRTAPANLREITCSKPADARAGIYLKQQGREISVQSIEDSSPLRGLLHPDDVIHAISGENEAGELLGAKQSARSSTEYAKLIFAASRLTITVDTLGCGPSDGTAGAAGASRKDERVVPTIVAAPAVATPPPHKSASPPGEAIADVSGRYHSPMPAASDYTEVLAFDAVSDDEK